MIQIRKGVKERKGTELLSISKSCDCESELDRNGTGLLLGKFWIEWCEL